MSVLRDAMDHATLGWIRPELDAVLLQVRQEVESQIEDGADPSGMRAAAAQLHQVQGSLKMVELYAPAMAAGEMESLALALANGEVEARDEACAVLMRGAMQLPDYLERLQSGHRDIPIVLMPLINDLRAARGVRPVSEAALFSPELDRPLPGYASEPAAVLDQEPRTALASLRKVLDNWNSGRAIDVVSLHDSLAALAGQDISAQARRLLWVAKDIAAALRDEALMPSATLRDAFASVEREARGLFGDDDQEAPASLASLSEPTRQLLFHAASSKDEHPSLQRLRESFALGNVSASEDEIAHARASVSGRNRALLDTVAAAVKEDVLRIKDALDLHLRTGRQDAESLAPQVEALTRVADTLGMLGLGAVRDLVAAQAGTVDALAKGTLPMSDGPLLDVAGALLYVDASLDDQVARLGEEERNNESAVDGLGAAEAQNLLDALTREAIANFGDARQGFVGFIETGWDHSQLGDIPRLLREVTGALRMLGIDEAADYVSGIQRYTEIELIGKKRVPGNQKLDTLADAMSSVEYYLEALREQRGGRDDTLAIARHSLELLHYWPLPDENALTEDAPFTDNTLEDAYESWLNDAARADLPAPAAEIDLDSFELDDEVRESAVAAPAQHAPADAAATPHIVAASVAAGPLSVETGGFDLSNDEIDDEIREIFLEEFSEEIQRLEELMPAWKHAPEDVEALRPIRRVFHTLKGSGRLVGARRLAEFSWKIENMLNRVLDGTRAPSDAVIGLVAAAQTVLPSMHGALLGVPASLPLAEMEAVADRLAAGEEVVYVAPIAATAVADEVIAEHAVIDQATDAAADAISVVPMVNVAVDAVLLEILGSEVDGHLGTIDSWLADAEQRQQPPSNAVLRAVHTMNGAFAMAEVPEITDATAPAEGWLKRLVAAGQAAGDEGIDVLHELGAQIRATIAGLQNTPQQVPMQKALKARFEQLRDALPEAVSHPALGPAEAIGLLDLEAERVEAERAEAERAEAERAEAERAEAERAEAERVEAERLEAERVEAERVEAERAEAERAEAERAEAERVEAERLEAERVETERVEAERAEAERAEAERLEAERVEAERIEAERLEAERLEAERLEAERLEAERVEAERIEAERLEAERVEAERIEAERLEAERVEAERVEAERLEAERIATDEDAEYARLEAQYADEARQQAEADERARLAAEQAEADQHALAEAGHAEAADLIRLRDEAARMDALRSDADAQAEALALAMHAELAAANDEEAVLAQARHEAELLERERQLAEQRLADDALSVEAEAPEAHAAVEIPDQARLLDEIADSAIEIEPPAELVEVQAASSEVVFEDDEVGPAAALDLAGMDEELLEIFVEEGRDLLDQADSQIQQLRADPADAESLIALQRSLHTVKGGARMAGLMTVGDLGHAIESLLEAVAESRIELTDADLALVECALDRLHAMLGRVGQLRAVHAADELVQALNARGRGEDRQAEHVEAEPVPAVIELAALSAPIDLGLGEIAQATHLPQEQVRVRADLLDRLVNYAGEVAIYRSRLEQQLGAFRSAMTEMEQTNTRLRDQLRRLDIETEAQIIARYQREQDAADTTFDPLELDRFSTLQQLSRGLGESANDLSSLQGSLEDLTRQYETLLMQQSRVSTELQEGLMRTRMVAVEGVLPRLRRVVRQAGNDTGKQVHFMLDGAHGELDRNVLDRMLGPLEHLLRNAIAHGIEPAEARIAAGKPEAGQLRLQVRQEGSEVVLAVADDGRGLDHAAIRRRAEERGLIPAGAELSESRLNNLILVSGFSTVDSVSQLAGRGVGMDVVNNEVRQIGGSLDIASKAGEGSTFTLRLPQTLAVTQAVFVRIGDATFAVPVASVRGVSRIDRAQYEAGDATHVYGGEEYRVHDLGKLLGQAPAKAEGQLQIPLLLVRAGDLRVAVGVDQIIGNREIVVKPTGPQIASVPGIFGATIMGDGRVMIILDVAPLARRYESRVAEGLDKLPGDAAAKIASVPLVMVVDDSITMRKVTSRVLSRQGFEVVTAKDGIDALERMEDRVPDLMLLDIEMPRMDGYELATEMKRHARMRHVPIVMITSRTGDKHRQRAFDLGVNRYLGKPYQETDLLRNVNELLGLGRDKL